MLSGQIKALTKHSMSFFIPNQSWLTSMRQVSKHTQWEYQSQSEVTILSLKSKETLF
jgi:hypothetical protein